MATPPNDRACDEAAHRAGGLPLWGANSPSVALAAKVFIPVWLVVAIANLWVGVTHAGYTMREELPILGIVFVAPAAVAALAIWHFSRP